LERFEISMKIPYARQKISNEDINQVKKILSSDFLTQGPTVSKFEKKIKSLCGASNAVAVNSATSALHIACLALDLGPKDWLWTSANSFVSSANSALFCGANVDFVDIDPITYNMSVSSLSKKLLKAKKQRKLPKILMPVHFAGQSCDMSEIYKLSKKYKFKIIEDASHALGASYKKAKVGSCKYSDITVFSFHAVKIITTGEGGAATTNSAKLANKMMLLRSHGVTRDPQLMDQKPDGEWYYQQILLGFNYRITDFQAALGISQIKKLSEFIKNRNKIFNFYNKALKNTKWVLPKITKDNYSANHLYVIRLPHQFIKKRKKVFEFLRKKGIIVNVLYIPIYKQPYYKNLKGISKNLLNCENYYNSSISIPMYVGLSQKNQIKVIKVLKEVMNKCIENNLN